MGRAAALGHLLDLDVEQCEEDLIIVEDDTSSRASSTPTAKSESKKRRRGNDVEVVELSTSDDDDDSEVVSTPPPPPPRKTSPAAAAVQPLELVLLALPDAVPEYASWILQQTNNDANAAVEKMLSGPEPYAKLPQADEKEDKPPQIDYLDRKSRMHPSAHYHRLA